MKSVVLLVAISVCLAATNLTAPQPSQQYDLSELLETSYKMREEANKIRLEAYELVRKALEIKEEAMDTREATLNTRSDLERSMLETLTLVNTHTIAATQNMALIKSSLSAITDRLHCLEEKFETLDEKVDSETQLVLGMSKDLSKIKNRQEHIVSEVKLISLYKMSDQTSYDGTFRDSDLIVDGQFMFDKNVLESMQTYTKTDANPGNKLNVHLGGLFRIYRVKVWNVRFCCQDRFIGTRIYADDRMIGVALQAKPIYSFDVAENDPTYARKITLHQELGKHLHILEVQVWGSGPYAEEDLFA
ncbi:hypothetical protein ACHWQZ_G014384 [Mnemiopsis leidyi]